MYEHIVSIDGYNNSLLYENKVHNMRSKFQVNLKWSFDHDTSQQKGKHNWLSAIKNINMKSYN